MTYLIPVFMGSKSDMDFARPIFEELDSLGIEHSTEILSGEKVPYTCLARVRKYDRMKEKTPFMAVVGMSNTMGPLMNGDTINPVVAVPKGSKEEVGIDVFSSIRRPKDAPLITVLGDGKAAGRYMAEIVGLGDSQVKSKICERKNIRYPEYDCNLPYIVADNAEIEEITGSKMNSFNTVPIFYNPSDLKNVGELNLTGFPIILVSEISGDNVRRFAAETHLPLIVVPPYGSREIRKLRKDVDKYMSKSYPDLPVGIVLSPENAVLAALKISSLTYEAMSEGIRTYMDKVKAAYKKRKRPA
jgi:phosphoribosylaminoimidazole carboxylase PurE protein